MPWTAYLQRYYLERGGQFVRQKLQDKTPIRSNNLSYNMLVFFKEICNGKSAFKLKPQAKDSLISETLLCFEEFFNHSNRVSKSTQYLTVADPDLQIRGEGAGLKKKNIFGPLGLSFV